MKAINKSKILPVFRMHDTDFYVDTVHGEFTQVDAPWNHISMQAIRETEDESTELAFDTRTRNVCQDILDPANIPSYIRLVIVPSLKELDPVGVARKLRLPDTTQNRGIQGKRRHRHGL